MQFPLRFLFHMLQSVMRGKADRRTDMIMENSRTMLVPHFFLTGGLACGAIKRPEVGGSTLILLTSALVAEVTKADSTQMGSK